MSAIAIEPMRVEDLGEVCAIERASFTSPWSRHAFRYELDQNRAARCWVARRRDGGGAGPVAGYICVWLIADEVHVTNLAVRPEDRQQGIGRRLLGTVLALYAMQGAVRAALEVRPGNREALQLYESFGFRQVGRRRGYYFDTGEDALLLEATLPAGEAIVPGPPVGNLPSG
jgi:ribosomal-protein-alanine N-acetyltransferase